MNIDYVNERFTVTLKAIALQHVTMGEIGGFEAFSDYGSIGEILNQHIGFTLYDHENREHHSYTFEDGPKNDYDTQQAIVEAIEQITGTSFPGEQA